MTRLKMFGAAACAALMISPIAAMAQDITITGPRSDTIREPGSMIELAALTDSSVINYSDLDLHTAYGRDMLAKRVNAAARHTCNKLDDRNAQNVPLVGPRTDLCMIYAMGAAQPQIDRAIELYGS